MSNHLTDCERNVVSFCVTSSMMNTVIQTLIVNYYILGCLQTVKAVGVYNLSASVMAH